MYMINKKQRRFYSSYFKCDRCGRVAQLLVKGDTCTCSNCGGVMHRT